jgi:diguanylate cyclase (GGDEF)-like protein/PAS domain S-box-containing protein
MNSQQLDIDQTIRKEQINTLYERCNSANLTLLVANTIYILFLSTKFAWKPLCFWYLALIVVLVGRLVMTRSYAKVQNNRILSMTFWLNIFRLGVLAVGLTLGSLIILFFPQGSLSYLLMAIIYPFGVVAGAASILVDFKSFFIYATTLMLPIIYQTAMVGNREYLGTGILTFLLFLLFLKLNKVINNNFLSTLRLRYENKNLVEDLKEEKNKLNNRLGRIFNDSSNEIFIVEANTLNFLQVNMGAVENLGYSNDEFSGICLLDVFIDQDNQKFSELIAPLRDGSQETVVHKGMNRRKDGSTYPVEARIQISSSDDPPIIVVIAQDITERSEWEDKLLYQANFDQLTGLRNRHYMKTFMDLAFTRARRHRQKVALLFLDLDNFKDINDALGHYTGDEVLKQAATRISTLLRETDTPARTGGDEFTILLEELEENSHAEVVASKLVEGFKAPFVVEGQEVYTTVSIGISIYPDDGESLDQLMQYADMAMYQAKEDGRNHYRFFSREICRSSEEQIVITNHLRDALKNDEFSLFFQPKIDIFNGRISGAEALLRWHNDELGSISPVVFIPLAEKFGFIREIGSWVIEVACKEAMRWQEISSEKVQVSVNVSPQQFRTGTLLEAVDSALIQSGLPCDYLELEITESLLLQDSDSPLTILENLHGQGITLALDDFGTGYSSLSYLKRFPLQVLKIDRSFISGLQEDQNNKALVEAIIAMAHSLKLEVVAEGVENKGELDFLYQRDVAIIQGYFFSPPVSAGEFRTLLENQSSIMEKGPLCFSEKNKDGSLDNENAFRCSI